MSVPVSINQTLLIKSLDNGKSLFTKDLKKQKQNNESTKHLKNAMMKNGQKKSALDFWFDS